MSYRELFKKENTDIRERYDLAVWRIEQILTEKSVNAPFDDFFRKAAEFILYCDELILKIERDELLSAKEDEWRRMAGRLYEDVRDEKRDVSYAFRKTAERRLGDEFGALLSHLYMLIREMTPAVFECRRLPMTIRMELFIEIYNYFEQGNPARKSVSEAIYWFVSDYADLSFDFRIRELFDGRLDYCRKLLERGGAGSDLSYLFQYGFDIGESAIKRAKTIKTMPERDISEAAEACIQGLSCIKNLPDKNEKALKKRYLLSYAAGSERIVQAVISKLEAFGAEAVIARGCTLGVSGSGRGAGAFASGENFGISCEDGHRDDVMMYADGALYERYLSVAKYSLEKYSGLSGKLCGIIYVGLSQETGKDKAKEAAEKTAAEKKRESAAEDQEITSKWRHEYSSRTMAAAESYCLRLSALESEYMGTSGDGNIKILV